MAKLAIFGGKKVRTKPFPAYNNIGKEEESAAVRVLRSGVLSGYIGAWHKKFYGGDEVQDFEKAWSKYFKVKHAIAVNSATSGIYSAVGACGIGPADEVIVSPYSMTCSATAPLIYGAIPVFADIEDEYFCLSASSIEKKITKRTRAIIVVDIFGQPYDADAINEIAKKHKLLVIEDAAQALGAKYRDKYAGTLADIGIFSLNFHKHIHTGEGGVVVTNDDKLAERVRMIRNHAESVVDSRPDFDSLINMVGFNYRMTELVAAIGKIQLKKLKKILQQRKDNVDYLSKRLGKIPCLKLPKTRNDATHSYYYQPLIYNKEESHVPRNVFVDAVKAELSVYKLRETEGVTLGKGYVKPIYLLPLFQKKIAFGGSGWPWANPGYKGKADYTKGICPITEKMWGETLITNELFKPPMTKKDLDDVADAFEKVWEYKQELL